MTDSSCPGPSAGPMTATQPDWQRTPAAFDIDPESVEPLIDLTLPFDGRPSDKWDPSKMTGRDLASWAKALPPALDAFSTALESEVNAIYVKHQTVSSQIEADSCAIWDAHASAHTEASENTRCEMSAWVKFITGLCGGKQSSDLGSQTAPSNEALEELATRGKRLKMERDAWRRKRNLHSLKLAWITGLKSESVRLSRDLNSKYAEAGLQSHFGEEVPQAYKTMSAHYQSASAEPAPAARLAQAASLAIRINDVLWRKDE